MRQYRFITLIMIAVGASWIDGHAVTRDDPPRLLLNTVARNTTPITGLYHDMYRNNAGAMVFMDSITISNVTISYSHESLIQPVKVQMGRGGDNLTLHADSYCKMSPLTAVWGIADYTKGHTYGVSFTDCIDYEMLAPYVMGDDRGGRISAQSYIFGGGWSHIYGKWTVGMQAKYRAEIAHRSVDPRIRDIVSDLDIHMGLTRRLHGSYVIGANIALKIYNQNSDVVFLNPVNTTQTFVYAGMGTHFARFTGNKVDESGHRAMAFSAGLQLLPVTPEGLIINAKYSLLSTDLRLRDLNNLTPGKTSTTTLQANIGWMRPLDGQWKIFPLLNARLHNRQGTENLLGTGVGDDYSVIGKRKNYIHRTASFSATCPVEWQARNRRFILTASPEVTYTTDKEELIAPSRKLLINSTTFSFDVNTLIKATLHSYITINTGLKLTDPTPKTPTWGDLDTLSGAGAALKHNYSMLCARNTCFTASASYSLLVSRVLYTLSAGYRHISYNHVNNKGNRYCIAITASF